MQQKDIDAILNVHRQAFGTDEGPVIEDLARVFLQRAETLSVSVSREDKIVGNVLFTPFIFDQHPEFKCYLLAPCGVLPGFQGRGVGKEMMETSIIRLREIGTDAVFVLGVPTFYPRYGFVPTDKQTPYPDLLAHPEAWMGLELVPQTLDQLDGPTRAIPEFMQPEMWDTSQHG
jgi:predicted N-acetyltransferase YhbS